MEDENIRLENVHNILDTIVESITYTPLDQSDQNEIISAPSTPLSDDDDWPDEFAPLLSDIDISNTTHIDRVAERFTTQLMDDILNNLFRLRNTNNRISRLQNQSSILNTVINESFYETCRFKNVISEEGKNLLKTDLYSNITIKNSFCPISQEDFSDNDIITILPCNHGFFSAPVIQWLETEKAKFVLPLILSTS